MNSHYATVGVGNLTFIRILLGLSALLTISSSITKWQHLETMPAWQLHDARRQAALHCVNAVMEINNAALLDLYQGLHIYNELRYPAERSFHPADPALCLTALCTGHTILRFLDLNPFSCQYFLNSTTQVIFLLFLSSQRWLL